MKKSNVLITACVAGFLLSGISGVAIGGDVPSTPLSSQETEKLAQLSEISNDRASTIDSIIEAWLPAADSRGYTANAGWEADFAAILEGASTQQLYDILYADNYDAVTTILRGGDVSSLPSDVTGISALGDLSADLVYTPVTPCRIFDTRFDSSPTPNGGDFQMHYFAANQNSITDISNQGGNSLGCPEPLGRTEPSAIVANFTVVPYGKGHIRVYPYTYPQPNASFLNFNTNASSSVANAGIITNCYVCGQEITVATYVAGSADSLADVMGYFYPAELNRAAPTGSYSGSTTYLSSSCTNYANGSVSITVPSSGKVTVTATAEMYAYHTNGASTWGRIYLGTNATDCTFSDTAGGYVATIGATSSSAPSGTQQWTTPVQRTFTVSPGTYTFYLNGIGTTNTAFYWSSMQAHFEAN